VCVSVRVRMDVEELTVEQYLQAECDRQVFSIHQHANDLVVKLIAEADQVKAQLRKLATENLKETNQKY